jgi:trigger factor
MSNETKFKVALGEYKGLKVKRPSSQVTDEELEALYTQQARVFAQRFEVKGRAVKNGDVATIDFTGYVDGEAFEGGAGNDYPLEIGSGTFIPGFEEQIIGSSVGDAIDVNVTFPDDYGAPSLAGKAALFKVKVNKIEEVNIPVLDDNVRKDLKARLEEQKATQNEIELEGALIAAVVNVSDVEVPDDEIETETKSLVAEWKMAMKQRGIDPDQYFSATGLTEAQLGEQLKPKAENGIKSRLVLEAIARTEQLEVTPEDIEERVELMAKQFNTTPEDIKEKLGDDHVSALTADLRLVKAVALIKENAEITEA